MDGAIGDISAWVAMLEHPPAFQMLRWMLGLRAGPRAGLCYLLLSPKPSLIHPAGAASPSNTGDDV